MSDMHDLIENNDENLSTVQYVHVPPGYLRCFSFEINEFKKRHCMHARPFYVPTHPTLLRSV